MSLFIFQRNLGLIRVCLIGLCLLSFLPAQSHAQALPASLDSRALVDFDQTVGMPPYVFRTYQFISPVAGKVRVEVYIGMVNDILQFVKQPVDTSGNVRYDAHYEVNIMIWDKNNLVDNRTWKRELSVDNFDSTNDRLRLNIERAFFDLPPGEYEIGLEITDRDTGKNLRERRPLKVSNFADGQLHLSSVVLTYPISSKRFPSDKISQEKTWPALVDIWRVAESSALRDSLPYNIASIVTNQPAMSVNSPPPATLEKSSQKGWANPPAPWAIGQGAYFEIYGAGTGDTLQLRYEIRDWRQQIVQEWNETITAPQSLVCHLVVLDGKISRPGRHTFRVIAKRVHTGASTAQKEVIAEENFQARVRVDQSYTAQILQSKSALSFEPLRYVLKSAEYKRIGEASEATRDSLIAEFWRQRDPNPETAANELRDEFYRRVAFAEMRFAVPSLNKSGWETDRGRIYIIYGPPKEVHYQLAEQGSPPYEIWSYPALDLYFVFRDKTGSGDFELVNR